MIHGQPNSRGSGVASRPPRTGTTSGLLICVLMAGGATPSEGASQLVMLAGLVIVVVSLMIFTHRRVRRAQKANIITPRKRPSDVTRHGHVRQGIDEAITQLDQLARQVHGQLDTRFAKLETVIRDADQRIAQLTKLSKQDTSERTLDVTLEEEDPLETQPAAFTAKAPSPSHAHASVWRLADGGMPAPEIAKEVGKLTGEVELILSLRRAREASGALPPNPIIRSKAAPSAAQP